MLEGRVGKVMVATALLPLLLVVPPRSHSQGAPAVTERPYTSSVSGAYAQDIVVSPKGGWLYLVGTTTDPAYPVTPDAYDSTCGTDGRCSPIQGRFGPQNSSDVVFTVLDSAGQVRYSTFLGGSSFEDQPQVAVARDGRVWIAGRSSSRDFGPADCVDATWIAEFDFDFRTLRDFHCLPIEAASDIAVDDEEMVWVLASTFRANLPTPGGWQPRHSGFMDMYVMRLAPGETTPALATYIGGSSLDQAVGFAITSTGAIAVAGHTSSQDFPVVRAYKPVSAVSATQGDAVVVVLDRSLRFAQFSTYWGGDRDERAGGIAADRDGNIYVTGQTSSANMPVTTGALDARCGIDGACDGSMDAFVARFSATGALLASTYYGGRGVDLGLGVLVRPDGRPVVLGSTQSPDFPLVDAVPPRRWSPSINFEHVFLSQFDAALQRVTRAEFVADEQYLPNIGRLAESGGFAHAVGQVFPRTGLPSGVIGTYARSIRLLP
jgi:hypothetical protein